MNGLIEAVTNYLAEHWLEVFLAAGSAVLGWFLGTRRARNNWKNREFFDRLNVSLTSIVDGKLLIRTLVEKRCEDVFLNKHAAETVIAAARETKENQPLLALPEDDYWYYLNAVLNEIAEKFADGQLFRDAGLPVQSVNYRICLTSESAGAIRTRKVRAMVVQAALVDNLPTEQPAFESPNHITRWQTLQQLAQEYQTHPGRFLTVEICLPK